MQWEMPAPSKKQRILIAEDEPLSRRMLEITLSRWGFEVVMVADGLAAWAVLQQPDAPRLALLDWRMPGLDGVELCRRLRAREGEYTYILLLTSHSTVDQVVLGLEAGADDYVVKPFVQRELQARLRAGARVLALQSDLVAAREELRRQATIDPLTEVMNRRALIPALERDLARALRDRTELSVLMVDVDRFKAVNDEHGHVAGDAVLREVARRLSAMLRAGDLVGRYGGEEFLILLPCCPAREAVLVAERLRAAISSAPIDTEQGPVRVTASFGAAALAPSRKTALAMVAAADEALYKAKATGRDCVVLAPHASSFPTARTATRAGRRPGARMGSP